MALEEVKQYWIATCDCCGKTKNTASRSAPSDWVQIDVGQAALDHHGNAVADGSVHLMLCRDCGIEISAAMNAAAEKIRNAARDTPTPEKG